MNWSLVKKDFMLLLKSPLTYIGVLSMVVILYITVSPYIKLYDDFQPDGETMEYSYDGNITDGYIPTPENERWEYVSQEMEAYLVSECEMSHEDSGNMSELIEQAQGHVWKCRVSNENKAREVEQRYHVSAKQLTSDGLLMKIISSSHPDIECWPCEASLEDAYIYLSNIKT